MRRHKAVARIFLFLSFANFTFAGVAQISMMHETGVDSVTGAEDVTEASERRHTQSKELPEWMGRPSPSTAGHLHSRFDLIPAQSFNTDPLDPNAKKFFNTELIRKMKEYMVLGTVAGIFTGIANGVQKQISGTVSPGAYVFFLPLLPPPSCPHLNGRGSQTLADYGVSHSVKQLVAPLNL